MNKNLIIYIIFAISLFVLGLVSYRFFYYEQPGSELSEAISDPFQEGIVETMEDYIPALNEKSELSWEELLESIQLGKISLILELNELRENCKENSTIKECNQFVLKEIKNNTKDDVSKKLQDLYSKYFLFEDFIESLDDEDLDVEFVKQKRSKFFSNQESIILFQLEDSLNEFEEKVSEIFNSDDKLTADQKLKKYKNLKKQIYGKMHDAIVSREDPYSRYMLELRIREDEINQLPEEEANIFIQKLQVKHLGQEGAELLQQSIQEEAEFFPSQENDDPPE
jgi:hypothetical protein